MQYSLRQSLPDLVFTSIARTHTRTQTPGAPALVFYMHINPGTPALTHSNVCGLANLCGGCEWRWGKCDRLESPLVAESTETHTHIHTYRRYHIGNELSAVVRTKRTHTRTHIAHISNYLTFRSNACTRARSATGCAAAVMWLVIATSIPQNFSRPV